MLLISIRVHVYRYQYQWLWRQYFCSQSNLLDIIWGHNIIEFSERRPLKIKIQRDSWLASVSEAGTEYFQGWELAERTWVRCMGWWDDGTTHHRKLHWLANWQSCKAFWTEGDSGCALAAQWHKSSGWLSYYSTEIKGPHRYCMQLKRWSKDWHQCFCPEPARNQDRDVIVVVMQFHIDAEANERAEHGEKFRLYRCIPLPNTQTPRTHPKSLWGVDFLFFSALLPTLMIVGDFNRMCWLRWLVLCPTRGFTRSLVLQRPSRHDKSRTY